jgi:hypothetical protein
VPHFTVGHITIIAAGYSEEVLAEMAEQEVGRQLCAAREVYVSGQRQGLIEALNLLRAHRPQQPWLDWVLEGVQRELLPSDKTAGRNRGGRLSNERARRRQRLIDYARTRTVNRFLAEGLTLNAACARAAQQLRIEVEGRQIAGSKKVFEQTYARFYFHLGRAPQDFYPLLINPLELLDLLSSIPSGGVAQKMFNLGLEHRGVDPKILRRRLKRVLSMGAATTPNSPKK